MIENVREKIKKLKKQRDAVILAHNYQSSDVQDIADYLGDSLELSILASKTDAEVIVFCGVHFMAETASIVCPDKKVLIPEIIAGCPMAKMITPEKLRELKEKHPNAVVVGYVNTSAAVKAETDLCCTSTNAVKVVNSVPKDKEIIFIPDKHLADYVSRRTKRKLIAWNGFCPTHVKITAEDILNQKKKYPGSVAVIHPECTFEAIDVADEVASTSGMIKFAKKTDAKIIIVGTETGLIYRLKKENPDKEFYPANEKAICKNMKLITPEKVLQSLEELKYEVKVPSEIRKKAIVPVEKMLKIK
ncbi:MAG: quinolinate synthase NadA [Candidatus Omnitrophota bacterium]